MHAITAYRAALGYAALGAFGWFTIAVRQWIFRRRYFDGATQFYA